LAKKTEVGGGAAKKLTEKNLTGEDKTKKGVKKPE